MTILQRRLASSPEAIYQSLKRRRERLEKRLREEELLKRGATVRVDMNVGLPTLTADELDDLDDAPDAEVQAAVRDVFAAFAACGSAYGVVAAFSGRRFPLRAYGGHGPGSCAGGNSPTPA